MAVVDLAAIPAACQFEIPSSNRSSSLNFPIARPANPRDIPDNMTLDSFEIVEDGIAAVWLL